MRQPPLVLMYHSVIRDSREIPPLQEAGGDLYTVTVEQFKEHMKLLKDKGFGPEDVLITFDDGEKNNYKHAFPVLKAMGWKAYFFVIVKRVGKAGYMNWTDLKHLQKEGMVIGSHGLTHAILTGLLDSQMEEELRASKKALEINLGMPVDAFSVPRGFCNDKVIAAAYGIGYTSVFISQRPCGLKLPAMPRIAVKRKWSAERFCLALENKMPFTERATEVVKQALKAVLRDSGYDWLRKGLLKLT